jgi:hypothetical protein
LEGFKVARNEELRALHLPPRERPENALCDGILTVTDSIFEAYRVFGALSRLFWVKFICYRAGSGAPPRNKLQPAGCRGVGGTLNLLPGGSLLLPGGFKGLSRST